MFEFLKSADFWYALALVLISATAIIFGKQGLKRIARGDEKGRAENDKDNS